MNFHAIYKKYINRHAQGLQVSRRSEEHFKYADSLF